jgi:hypothetical protein
VWRYLLDCYDCGRVYTFDTPDERAVELHARHESHELELARQAVILTRRSL